MKSLGSILMRDGAVSCNPSYTIPIVLQLSGCVVSAVEWSTAGLQHLCSCSNRKLIKCFFHQFLIEHIIHQPKKAKYLPYNCFSNIRISSFSCLLLFTLTSKSICQEFSRLWIDSGNNYTLKVGLAADSHIIKQMLPPLKLCMKFSVHCSLHLFTWIFKHEWKALHVVSG